MTAVSLFLGAVSGNYADDFEDDEADSDSIEEEVLDSDSSDAVEEECEVQYNNVSYC